MKLIYEIELPDNATPSEILNAIAQAGRSDQGWKKKTTRAEKMSKTDLQNKCGSCRYFRMFFYSEAEGRCVKGHPWGKRTRPCCKEYERRKGCPEE